MLVLPILLCCGPWLAILAMVVVAADAVCGDRLLSPDEKRQLAEALGNTANDPGWNGGFPVRVNASPGGERSCRRIRPMQSPIARATCMLTLA